MQKDLLHYLSQELESGCSGNLRLIVGEKRVTLGISNSAVRAVFEEGADASTEVARKLVAGGHLVEEALALIENAKLSLVQLAEVLVEQDFVEQDRLTQAIEGYHLDKLMRLREGNIEFADFKAGEPSDDHLKIPLQQLISEMSECDRDLTEFRQIFGCSPDPADLSQQQKVNLLPADHMLGELSPLEQAMMQDIGAAGTSLDKLVQKSMLSQAQLVSNLLLLHSRGAIFLDLLADTAVLAAGQSQPACASGAVATVKPVEADSGPDSLFDDLSEPVENVDAEKVSLIEASLGVGTSINWDELTEIKVESQANDSKVSEELKAETPRSDHLEQYPHELEPDAYKWNESKSATMTTSRRWTVINHILLEEPRLSQLSIGAIIWFLAVFSVLIVPKMEAWLKAVSEITIAH